MRRRLRYIAVWTAAVLLIAACASIGSPDGGPYDETPPVFLGSTPKPFALGVKEKRVTLDFDEFIKIEKAAEKVVISPPQITQPIIKTNGKSIIVELDDSLKANTTYSIDFSDAIVDNNEGNPLGNFALLFSTGEQIDTFEVAGTVLNATNLEPIKGILVGLYDNLSDTIFKKEPLMRISRTDSRGRFIIRGVAQGKYRVYALQDADGDFMYSQKSEMIAYSHKTFEPTCAPDIRQDTVWRDSLHIDSIIRVSYTHFYPDNVVLTAFTPIQTDRYLLKTERSTPEKFTLFFTYGSDTLPTLRGLNFNADDAFIIEASENNDTIAYWLKDTTLVNQDTLRFELQYMATDTTGLLVSKTDTIEALPKVSYEKRLKLLEKEIEEWKEKQEKAKKKGRAYDSIMPVRHMEVSVKSQSQLDPDKAVLIEVPIPLNRCDTSGIHLYSKIDTLWYNAQFTMMPVPGKLRQYQIMAEWRPDVEYSLEMDSAIFESIYGRVNAPIKKVLKCAASMSMAHYS